MPDNPSSTPGPLAGEPRERSQEQRLSPAARVGSWLTWWVLLMSLWIMLDDSVSTDELLAGAGAAVLAATFAELASYQAATRFRMRFEWLAGALRLPGQVAGDMVIVYRALWRRLAHGEDPASAFVTEPTAIRLIDLRFFRPGGDLGKGIEFGDLATRGRAEAAVLKLLTRSLRGPAGTGGTSP